MRGNFQAFRLVRGAQRHRSRAVCGRTRRPCGGGVPVRPVGGPEIPSARFAARSAAALAAWSRLSRGPGIAQSLFSWQWDRTGGKQNAERRWNRSGRHGAHDGTGRGILRRAPSARLHESNAGSVDGRRICETVWRRHVRRTKPARIHAPTTFWPEVPAWLGQSVRSRTRVRTRLVAGRRCGSPGYESLRRWPTCPQATGQVRQGKGP